MTYNKQTDIMTIKPEDCARGLLNDVGYEKVTNGHWSHSMQGWLYHAVPECLFNHVFLKYLGPDFMRERERAKKKQWFRCYLTRYIWTTMNLGNKIVGCQAVSKKQSSNITVIAFICLKSEATLCTVHAMSNSSVDVVCSRWTIIFFCIASMTLWMNSNHKAKHLTWPPCRNKFCEKAQRNKKKKKTGPNGLKMW